jgi:hypothetical protein
LFVHVFASIVVAAPVAVSISVAVAQSYDTVSVQTTLYQKLRVPPADGAVNVCEMEASPRKGLVLPTRAAYVPPWPPVTTAFAPVDVQPLSVPVSKSPFTMLDEVAAVMVTLTVVACVAEAVPVTVKVYVPAAAVPALTVSVDDPPAVTLAGLKPALAPEGAPLTESKMVSALPLVTAVEMLEVPLAF